MANDRIYSRRKKEMKVENEGEKSNQTDPFLVCSQQPRSRTDGCPKRRTDFSLFFSQLSPSHQDPESPGSKEGSCVLSATSQDGSPGNRKTYPGIHLVPCHQYEYAEDGETKSTRTVYKLQSEIARTEEVHLGNFMGARQEDVGETSLDQRFSSAGSDASCEHMTSDERANANAAASISRFEDGSPTSANTPPSEQPVEHHMEPSCSIRDSVNSVRSVQGSIDDRESGRGKRRRKVKIHFDELKHPVESAKRVRKLKIMRLLGLAAPAGSPLSPQ